VKPLHRLARVLGRQPWLAKVGPRLVTVDATLQRVTGGRIAVARLAGLAALLLTTTGRKSGQPRTIPLTAVPDGDTLLLVGSNWGKPGHPGWSANLIAKPEATVEIRGHAFPVTATLLTGEERARAWESLTETWPPYRYYATRTDREIRVFRVARR
jgi:deazaflavin-dependent oxidoreductase (nitroreductase family)